MRWAYIGNATVSLIFNEYITVPEVQSENIILYHEHIKLKQCCVGGVKRK